MKINWKEILLASAEVAAISAVMEVLSLQQISWLTLVPVILTFGIKFMNELRTRIVGTSGKNVKKVPKYQTLFFKKY